MKRWTLAGLFVFVLSLLLSEAHGDGIGPRRPGLPPIQPRFKTAPVKTKLVVKVDEKAKTPVLQVPLNLALGQLQMQPGFGQAPEPQDGRRFGLPTIVAGLALTLAFASGGLWMVRRGSRRTLATIVVMSVFAAGTAAVWADLAPRPRPGSRPRPAPVKPELPTLKLPANIELTDKITLEPVAIAGDHLTLIVPKSMVVEKDKEKEASREKRDR